MIFIMRGKLFNVTVSPLVPLVRILVVNVLTFVEYAP